MEPQKGVLKLAPTSKKEKGGGGRVQFEQDTLITSLKGGTWIHFPPKEGTKVRVT
jgi:hypothetical protein